MIVLEDLQGIRLSRGIRNLSPIQYDTIQVKNKLIDGSYHIQNIGTPLKFFTFEVLANSNQVDLINIAESRGEQLKFIIDDKYYIGMLGSRAEWERLTPRYKDKERVYFTSNLILNISEEGSI